MERRIQSKQIMIHFLKNFKNNSAEIKTLVNSDVNSSVSTIVQLYQTSGKDMVIKHCNDKGKGNSIHQPWKHEQCEQAKYAKYAALRLFRLNNQDNTNTNFIESR